ncbi:MAG: restriction endonuclease [Candidatus Thorarchaeota archaeon]
MTEPNAQRTTLREWLSAHARSQPIHYRKIAEALDRKAASVSASLSIEKSKAEEDNRLPYFVRVGPGLYQYNDLCEGAVDADLTEVRKKADEFTLATRNELRHRIAELDLDGFQQLAEIVLLNIRARVEAATVERKNNKTVVMTVSWRDDGGSSPVVVHARKCRYDEEIESDTILEIRGSLPSHQANQGVLITNGTVTDEAKKEALGYAGAAFSVPPVHLMDIDIILNVLLESRTGVRERRVEVLLPDDEFWERLSS